MSYDFLHDHPALSFVNIRVADDGGQLLRNLARIPSLRRVSIELAPKADAGVLKGLGSISRLDYIYWRSGRVDGDVLRSLAKGNCLNTLRLYDVDLGTDFLEGCQSLTHLTELDIVPRNTDDNRSVLARLPASLLRLPRLRDWPRLHKVNAAVLRQLTGLAHIERLALSDVASDVTPELLAGLGRLRRLRRLDLSNIPVDDDWLRNLFEAANLEDLELFDTRVTGVGFQALTGLKYLRRIRLYFADPEGPLNLHH